MTVDSNTLTKGAAGISAVSAEQFRSGMRMFAAGCTIIATADGVERAGLTATAVCSVSADPPLLLVCVNKNVHAHALIEHSRVLSVNILGRTSEGVAKVFAGMDSSIRGADRFSVGKWTTGKSGAPILSEANAVMDCVVVNAHTEGTHSIFVCIVVDVVADDVGNPLVYYDGNFSSVIQI